MKPEIGKTYLWDFGGRAQVPFTVRHVKTTVWRGSQHKDGSESPDIDLTWVSEEGTAYVQWLAHDFQPHS